MAGGSRRIPRGPRLNITHPVTPLLTGEMGNNKYTPLTDSPEGVHLIESPHAPKHYPIPNLPIDSTFMFETFMFLYTALGACLQYLHIYRSVWWLPHSYNTQTINFYLINGYVFVFIITVLSRRFIYMLGFKLFGFLLPHHLYDMACNIFRMFLLSILMGILCFCTYNILQVYPIYCMFYLCYPIIVYLILFGSTTVLIFDFVYYNENDIPALHACSSNPIEIRQEVENLKNNLNLRLKQVIFNSILDAYYAGLIPCCFVQSFVYYDIQWTSQHTFFLWVGSFIAYFTHIITIRYWDVLHRSALHLGYWVKYEPKPHLTVTQVWQDNVLWPPGVSVRHGDYIYRSIGETNAAEPGNVMFKRFYSMFVSPSVTFTIITVLQLMVVAFQLTLMFNSYYRWYNILSSGLLLLFNYYILYRIALNQRITHKVYNIESHLHSKESTAD